MHTLEEMIGVLLVGYIDWLIDLLTMTSSENEFHKQKQVMQKK